MTIINDTTVVVFSSAELKEALENNNGYTYIYFGSNITLTSGILISSNKSEVIIDGTYNDIIYEYVDQKKLGTGDGIRVNSALNKKVTVKNMKVVGYNYYGIIYVPESNTFKDTVIEYNNINYVGPQISFNPSGLTRFVDCDITIHDNYASGNEVCECNRVEIGGATTIIHKSTANSSFWFRNQSPSLTILKNAVVNFQSVSRELIYGVTDLNFVIDYNASFHVTTHNGMGYGNFGTGSTVINDGAELVINQTSKNGSYATWYSYGLITLNFGSTLSIISNYDSIGSANYNIYFQGDKSGLVLNNPEKVVLYNSVANVINTNSTSTFKFTYSRINLFDKAITISSEISKDTLPTYAWYKESELSSVDGSFSNSKTVVSSNNYTEEELKKLPSLDNFNILGKKIISVGTFLFRMAAVTDKDVVMTGITLPQSSVLIKYGDVEALSLANDDGVFTYSYSDPLTIGTIVTFNCKTHNDLLYYTKQIEIVYSGELTLDSATKSFSFNVSPISTNPLLCPRLTNLEVVVTDSRINSSAWKLYATIDHELESDNGYVLDDGLVFVDDLNNVTALSDVETLVYTGDDNGGLTRVTTVSWDDDKGILLQVKKPLENRVSYTAKIIWRVEE